MLESREGFIGINDVVFHGTGHMIILMLVTKAKVGWQWPKYVKSNGLVYIKGPVFYGTDQLYLGTKSWATCEYQSLESHTGIVQQTLDLLSIP
jgi:hypothetical protein